MAARVLLVTDGSADATALARWLLPQLQNVSTLDARSAQEVAQLVEAQRSERPHQRIVVVAEGVDVEPSKGLSAAAALTIVRKWLGPLLPFERRTGGASKLAELIRASAAGSEESCATILRQPGRTAIARGLRPAICRNADVTRSRKSASRVARPMPWRCWPGSRRC